MKTHGQRVVEQGLTSAEVWCLKECLTNDAQHGARQIVLYFIHKCEKNSVTRERCREMLEVFFDVPFCLHEPPCDGQGEWRAEDHRGIFDLTSYSEAR